MIAPRLFGEVWLFGRLLELKKCSVATFSITRGAAFIRLYPDNARLSKRTQSRTTDLISRRFRCSRLRALQSLFQQESNEPMLVASGYGGSILDKILSRNWPHRCMGRENSLKQQWKLHFPSSMCCFMNLSLEMWDTSTT